MGAPFRAADGPLKLIRPETIPAGSLVLEMRMSAQTAAPRSRRHAAAAEIDDPMVARAVEFAAWARRNATLLIIAGVVLVVAIGGFFWYRADQARQNERAAASFAEIQQMMAVGNTEAAVAQLDRFVVAHSGTVYADEGRIALGQHHLEEGNPSAAVAALQGMQDRIQSSPVGTAGALLLGTAQHAAGDHEAAIRTYLLVGERARFEHQRLDGLSNAALVREEAGDMTGAAELYRRILGLTPEGSFERSMYEMRLAEVEAQALAPATN
jgi:predicted negative regulator of RcsB-dependent stress response